MPNLNLVPKDKFVDEEGKEIPQEEIDQASEITQSEYSDKVWEITKDFCRGN